MKMRILVTVLLFPLVLGVKQICPGGTARCPDSSTCCQLPNGSYGCCPLKNAVCCDDRIHCCPSNTKCSAGMCVQLTNISTSAYPVKSNDIVCPGKKVACPDETTCCKSPPGQIPKYGCCPMPNAVCCNDGFHCCPNGTMCEVEKGKCLGDGYVTEIYHKKFLSPHILKTGLTKIRSSTLNVTSVVCPGSGFQCPDSYTCCKTESGDWGCCPFPKAVCCLDKIHCCPENMHCDATSKFCSQGERNTTALRKVPSKKISKEVEDVVCPDKSKCATDNTCCNVGRGKFGCCPYADATCCADLLHCCPSGFKCDEELKRCIMPKSWVSNALHDIFHKL